MADAGVKLVVAQRFCSRRFHDNSESAQFLSPIESTRYSDSDTEVWLLSVSRYSRHGCYRIAESARAHRPEINSVTKGLNRILLVLYSR